MKKTQNPIFIRVGLVFFTMIFVCLPAFHRSPPPPPHPLMVVRVWVQSIHQSLHLQQPAGQGQQQTEHLVQIPDEHVELLHLVGFAHRHHHALHLTKSSNKYVQTVFQAMGGTECNEDVRQEHMQVYKLMVMNLLIAFQVVSGFSLSVLMTQSVRSLFSHLWD